MTSDLHQLPALDDLEELAVSIRALRHMPPLERARLARDIAGPVRAALGHVVDESIAAALVDPFPQRRSYVDVAGALSVSTSRVNKSITRYRAWLNTRRAPKETAS